MSKPTLEQIENYYRENEDREIRFPRKRSVCPRCNGNGWVDSWEGGFTDSDLDEWYGDSPDRDEFIEAYKRGTYGIKCPECNGNNVVDELDIVTCPKELLDIYYEWMNSYYETEAIYASERRMGA
jgi:hypothetical protein